MDFSLDFPLMKLDSSTHPPTLLNFSEVFGEVEKISQGRYGIVYRVRQQSTQKLYALKVYKRFGGSADEIQPLYSQIIKCCRGNADVVQYYAMFRSSALSTPSSYMILMEYIEGQTLNKYFLSHPRLPEEEFLNILRWYFRMLHDLNRRLIHLDVHDDNIMIQPDGTLKLIDLDQALIVEGTEESKVRDHLFLQMLDINVSLQSRTEYWNELPVYNKDRQQRFLQHFDREYQRIYRNPKSTPVNLLELAALLN